MPDVAIVTGAAGGIGFSLCKEFREAGYVVVGLDRPGSKMPNSCNSIVYADLKALCEDTDYFNNIISEMRSCLTGYSLKVLVNNAAIQVVEPAEQLTSIHWHNTLDINLIAPFLLTQSIIPELTATQGSVINIASIHATLTKPGFVCYATSKTALIGLTQSLAVELGGRVRVNAIAPAAIATPMLLEGLEGETKVLNQLAQMHPINRIGTPQEVARAALFLASEQASFVTGAVLRVDGGMGSRLHDPG